MEQALPLLAAVLLVRFVALEATYQKARRVGAELRFPAGRILRVLLGVGLPLCFYGAYEATILARQTGEWWLPVICLAFVALAIAGDPGEIRVRPDGIISLRVFGLLRKHMGWSGVSARYTPELREVLVIGNDAATITHSRYHVGQSEFLFELKRYGVQLQ